MMKQLVLAVGFVAFFLGSQSFQKAYAVSSSVDSAAYFLDLGKTDKAARKYATAWSYFEKAASYDKKNPKIQLAISEVCMLMNRTAPALKALELATQLDPSDYSSRWSLVKMYFNFGQHQKVIDMLPEIRNRVDFADGSAFMLGKSYYSIQNYGKATDFLKLALKEDPKNSEASYLMGRMLVKMENYKAAAPYYETALSIDSASQPYRMYELALIYATAEQSDMSIQCFQKALDRGYKPQDDFYMNMAYTMADAHKSAEAVKIMRSVLSRRPQDLGVLNGLADVCYHSGRYQEAIGYWDRLLALNNNDARTLYHIGLAYIKLGKNKDGQQLCDQAIALNPALGVLKHAKQMM